MQRDFGSMLGWAQAATCPQEAASGIWEMNGVLSAWNRVAVKQSCRVTAVNKCDPASVLQSTAYRIPVHGTYEENRVGKPTYRRSQGPGSQWEAFISARPITRAHSGPGQSTERHLCSSGYSGYRLRMTLWKAGGRHAAGHLVGGQASPAVPGEAEESLPR